MSFATSASLRPSLMASASSWIISPACGARMCAPTTRLRWVTITIAPFVAASARAVGVDQVLAPDLDVAGAEPLLGLARGQPGVGELAVGEGAPRDEVGHLALPGEEHVAHRAHALVSGHVGEQVPAGDVADGVDRVDLGARPVVDHHPVAVELDPEALQAEAGDVRPPACADEDLGALPAALLAVLCAVDHLLAVLDLHARDVHAQAHVNALLLDAVLQDRHEVGLVAG